MEFVPRFFSAPRGSFFLSGARGTGKSPWVKHTFPEDLRGLTAFREDYPQSRCVLLYRGREPLRINHIDCLPVSQFLLQLHPDTPLFGRKK